MQQKKNKSNGIKCRGGDEVVNKIEATIKHMNSTHELSRLRFINFYGYALRMKRPIDIIEFLCN